jgi:hypothetical protein
MRFPHHNDEPATPEPAERTSPGPRDPDPDDLPGTAPTDAAAGTPREPAAARPTREPGAAPPTGKPGKPGTAGATGAPGDAHVAGPGSTVHGADQTPYPDPDPAHDAPPRGSGAGRPAPDADGRTPVDTDGGAAPDADGGPVVDADTIQRRWHEIQAAFVDDPRESVKRADRLVGDVVEDTVRALTARKQALMESWQHTGARDTERMRLALRDYRSLLGRLTGPSAGMFSGAAAPAAPGRPGGNTAGDGSPGSGPGSEREVS